MTGPRLPAPSRLPTVGDEARDAFRCGWWNGTVVGYALGFATAVLLGLVR